MTTRQGARSVAGRAATALTAIGLLASATLVPGPSAHAQDDALASGGYLVVLSVGGTVTADVDHGRFTLTFAENGAGHMTVLDGSTVGEWSSSGWQHAVVAGDVTMEVSTTDAAQGAITGGIDSLTMSGTYTTEVQSVVMNGTPMDVSGSGPWPVNPPIELGLTSAHCGGAVGDFVKQVEQHAADVGFTPDLAGKWTAIRVDGQPDPGMVEAQLSPLVAEAQILLVESSRSGGVDVDGLLGLLQRAEQTLAAISPADLDCAPSTSVHLLRGMIQKLVELALEDPDSWSVHELVMVLSSAIRTGAVDADRDTALTDGLRDVLRDRLIEQDPAESCEAAVALGLFGLLGTDHLPEVPTC